IPYARLRVRAARRRRHALRRSRRGRQPGAVRTRRHGVARHDRAELVRSVHGPRAAPRGGHAPPPPSCFDPSPAPPQITPFGMLYAIHDALVRPYPGHKMGPSLAESWEESEDGLDYEFKLRPGLKFHNGDPLIAEDVKFSFERYKGTGAKIL